MSKSSSLIQPRTVTGDGEGIVSHAGLVWLAEVADRTGLTAGLSHAMARLPRRRHDPGRTLAQMVLTLADGGTCVSDLAGLRDQPSLFGPVASHPTAWRAFDQIGSIETRGITAAAAEARTVAWTAGAGPAGPVTIIDIDATHITTRTDKQDAAPTYKAKYGHYPLLAMEPDTGEVLAVMMRPGNAGSGTAQDHVILLADTLAALPAQWQAGHHVFDTPTLVTKPVLIRTDSAGATHWLAEECHDRNLRFSFGYPISSGVRDALIDVEGPWIPARNRRKPRDGAWVTELTGLVDLHQWPIGTRLICRRERPHPGAQLSLFDTVEGFRHQCFITNQTDPDVVALERQHRQRGRAETIIRDTKACGLTNLPFDDIVNNTTWIQLAAIANNLLVWARRLTLTGPLRAATPKTIRHRLLHIAARISPQRLRLDRNWPWTSTLTDALNQLNTVLPPHTVTT